MNIADQLISAIAPFQCLNCSSEGRLLCRECIESKLPPHEPSCVVCGRLNIESLTCTRCRKKFAASVVYVATGYRRVAKDWYHQAKFDGARSELGSIARVMSLKLPAVMDGFVVVPVPTSPSHVRVRGYDSVWLLSKKISKIQKLGHKDLLARTKFTRQVGRTRQQRLLQQKGAFRVVGSEIPEKVLLVDDILTTGATIDECARTLKKSGVKYVYAIVFARA